MSRPASLWEQYAGKAQAAALQGSGLWPLQSYTCQLEPPWEPFDSRGLTSWEGGCNGWNYPWEGRWWKRWMFPPAPLFAESDNNILLPEVPWHESDQLTHIVVEQFPEDASTVAKADVFLRSLVNISAPVSFEILGMGAQPEFDHARIRAWVDSHPIDQIKMNDMICGWTEPYVKTQFVAHQSDAKQVQHQLLAQYPNSAILVGHEECDSEDWEISGDIANGDGYGSTLRLRHPYFQSVRLFTKLDPDPLGVILAAMDHLERDEWALLQILFQPAMQPWAETLESALRNPYSGKYWLDDANDRNLHEKFSSPLFAVTVRVAARTRETYHHLQGWAEQFAAPPQGFDSLLEEEEYQVLCDAVRRRCTYRPGMLLNAAELASLVHLPGESVVSERLQRVKIRTRRAPVVPHPDSSILLGENIHRGIATPAYIPAEIRPYHCYICGASGTGKSTLLLNMILQDLEAGRGVGVLDPHGDLIQDICRRMPEKRIEDVILFDPADDQFPIALNLLEAHDETEHERIVNETVMSLERYFPSSWGPRLQQILTFTLYTVLDAIPGATLADVERMLVSPKFREAVLSNTKNPQFVDYWNLQFVHGPRNAVDPVLNKLQVFLLNRTVRNIICQRHSAIDFDHILNDGKILLANLSTGLLTEKISGTLGSFLVTKIINAAFRRATIPEGERRPWYLYVDEFQAFMNLSIGFERILAESRKYKLILAGLANQYVGQVTPPVRQALFGNIGTKVAFRMGIEDAQSISRELGVFTPEEVLNLGVGQAFVRHTNTTSSQTFNLQTSPKHAAPDDDPTPRIQALTRSRYARPIADVIAELGYSNDNPKHTHLSDERADKSGDLSEDDFL